MKQREKFKHSKQSFAKRRIHNLKTRDFPSEEEQELVRKYVIERPLYRPPVTYGKAFAIVFAAVICMATIAVAVFFLLLLLGFSFNVFFYIAIYVFLIALIFLRRLAVLCIRLYQHYASEEVRRRCLLKPTCSEYAIIVIKKYGFVIGFIKTWIRLVCKCRGNVYYIDEP